VTSLSDKLRDAEFLRRAIHSSGRLIVAGPLNNAYEITIDGAHLFVRERVVTNSDYSQQFAAERHVRALLDETVRIPTLVQIVTDASGEERFAVFEFVVGAPPDWSDAGIIEALAGTLAAIHSIPGERLGNIKGPFSDLPVRRYLTGLLQAEASRLAADPRLSDAIALFAETQDAFDGEPIVLCHGDVHSGNFLSGVDGALWTLDWEACRYRVAAADFNQVAFRWMSPEQEKSLLNAYCDRTARDRMRFREQIRALRLLWHIRTFNFYVNVLNQETRRNEMHLAAARALLDR